MTHHFAGEERRGDSKAGEILPSAPTAKQHTDELLRSGYHRVEAGVDVVMKSTMNKRTGFSPLRERADLSGRRDRSVP